LPATWPTVAVAAGFNGGITSLAPQQPPSLLALWPMHDRCLYVHQSAGVARFAKKYPALLDALLRSMLELLCKYHKTGAPQPGGRVCLRASVHRMSDRVFTCTHIRQHPRMYYAPFRVPDHSSHQACSASASAAVRAAAAVIGEVDVVEREVDGTGQVYMTAAELMAEEVKRRGGEQPACGRTITCCATGCSFALLQPAVVAPLRRAAGWLQSSNVAALSACEPVKADKAFNCLLSYTLSFPSSSCRAGPQRQQGWHLSCSGCSHSPAVGAGGGRG
jgi:hypothetical protein